MMILLRQHLPSVNVLLKFMFFAVLDASTAQSILATTN